MDCPHFSLSQAFFQQTGAVRIVERGQWRGSIQLPLCYLFQGLSDSQLKRIAGITKEIPFRKRNWALHEGREVRELFVLKQGAVELVMKVEGEFEIPISILRKSGDSFGISALIAPHRYNLSARSVRDSTLLVIKRRDLKKIMQEDREFGGSIMTNLAEHLLARLKETRKELRIHFKTLLKSMHS